MGTTKKRIQKALLPPEISEPENWESILKNIREWLS